MATRTKLSELAADDLNEVMRYYCEELFIPQAAANFHNNVLKQIDLIDDNPMMYPLHHDEKLHAEGYRFVTIGRYLMFYIVSDDETHVDVVRIVYGGRDLSALFDTDSA